MYPHGTSKVLPFNKKSVVGPEVQSAAPYHTKVENLVAGTAKVECSGLTTLRKSEDVKKSPLDIQIASDCEHSHINRYLEVVLEAKYTDEYEYCTETSNEEHAAPYRPVFGTIELWD